MEWIESIGKAIEYIEDNLSEELSLQSIARRAHISTFYFQKGFAMLCGYTVGEYIRMRRLSLAGRELVSSDERVIDIALKYGYDSPDSFTRAFTRFHGVTPTAVRRNGVMVKSFAPMRIKILLEGGYIMDYRIVEKEAFTVLGAAKTFSYENAKQEIPKFWQEHYACGNGKNICGMYGINIDKEMVGDTFEYIIADNYNPCNDIPNGFETRVIPKHTWAVFACHGAMPDAIQSVVKNVFSQWLPACKEYEIAEGYNIEMYSDISKYPKGTADENYYSEVWIPVKKK